MFKRIFLVGCILGQVSCGQNTQKSEAMESPVHYDTTCSGGAYWLGINFDHTKALGRLNVNFRRFQDNASLSGFTAADGGPTVLRGFGASVQYSVDYNNGRATIKQVMPNGLERLLATIGCR